MFEQKKRQNNMTFMGFSILFAITIFSVTFITQFFVPDFINHSKITFAQHLKQNVFGSKQINVFVAGVFWCIFIGINYVVSFASWLIGSRAVYNFISFNKWFKEHIQTSTEIINNSTKFNPKVAFIVGAYNDFSEYPALQTFNQTYKNYDVWILDDSTKEDKKKQIDEFAKAHDYHVLRRPLEHKKAHPSFFGNIHYFLETHGKEYEYMLETNSSSILTETFVENSLSFFHSKSIDTKNLAFVTSNSSFYTANNFFSFIVDNGMQWNNMAFNETVHNVNTPLVANGNGTLWKMSILLNIPIDEVECTMCDIARPVWLAHNGYYGYYNPFDFQGKLVTQNIYRYKNQSSKWTASNAFIFRKHFSKKFDSMKLGYIFKGFMISGVVIAGWAPIFGFANMIFALAVPALGFANLTAQLIVMAYNSIYWIIISIIAIVNHISIRMIIFMLISNQFGIAMSFKTWYSLVFVGIFAKKWSATKAITIKTSEKLKFKDWLKINTFDIILLLVLASISPIIIIFGKLPWNLVLSSLFGFIGKPSILWILSSFLSLIPYKKGWDNDVTWFNIYERDYRYKLVKESEIWKKQHPIYRPTERKLS